jgi:hypothetical protein
MAGQGRNFIGYAYRYRQSCYLTMHPATRSFTDAERGNVVWADFLFEVPLVGGTVALTGAASLTFGGTAALAASAGVSGSTSVLFAPSSVLTARGAVLGRQR